MSIQAEKKNHCDNISYHTERLIQSVSAITKTMGMHPCMCVRNRNKHLLTYYGFLLLNIFYCSNIPAQLQ